MITKEEANRFLETKKIEKPNLGKLIDYEASYRQLGKIITLSTKEHKENAKKHYTKSRSTNEINIEVFNETFKEKEYDFNPFESEEGERLAKFLFGEVLGSTVAKAWDKINEEPYQTGYYRRSFRRRKPSKSHLEKKLVWVQDLYLKRIYSSAFFNISMGEIIQYMVYDSGYYDAYALSISVYVERENQEEIKELIWDIFLAEDEIGAVTGGLIRGLLLSNDEKSWEMVAKLLLSAQRQEGLRQTILEALDETSVGALKYMIKVILENDLYRFSSVVRAVDTWFGFGWEAPKKAVIKKILELSNHYFENLDEIEKTMQKSRNNLEIYVALWVKAVVFDVNDANLLAIEMIKTDKTKEKKLLAFMFMKETNRTDTELVEWIYENFGKGDVFLDYYMLSLLPKHQAKEMVSNLFEKIKTVAKSIPKDGVKLNGKVFEWKALSLSSDYFYSKLLANASDDILKELGQDIVAIPSDVRATYMGYIFPKHKLWGWDASRIHQEKLKPLELDENSWKREVLYQALVDKNTGVQATGLNVLRSIELYAKEYEVVEDLFKRKSKNLRSFLIEFILKQDETKISSLVEGIIEAKDSAQRLGGLEILTLLDAKNKMNSFVKQRVESYTQRKKISKNEEVFLSKFNAEVKELEFTHANGYAVIDYTQLQKIYEPTDKFSTIEAHKNIFDEFIDHDKIAKSINSLVRIFKAKENHEYAYEDWDGELVTTLLGKRVTHSKRDLKGLSKEEQFKLFPLYEVWEKWYRDSDLNDIEMMVAYGVTTSKRYSYIKKPSKEIIARYYPTIKGMNLKIVDRWESFDKKIHELIKEVFEMYCDRATITSFQLDMRESMMINYPTQIQHYNAYTIGKELEYYWDLNSRELELIERNWRVDMSMLYRRLNKKVSKDSSVLAKKIKIKNINKNMLPNSSFTLRLYREEILNHHDFFYHLLLDERQMMGYFENRKNNEMKKDFFSKISKESKALLERNYAQLKENFLEVELARGDLKTEVSEYVGSFSKIEGINYFKRILLFIGKSKLNTHTFSSMLSKTHTKESETYEDFEKAVKELKLTNKRWLEIAMYVPQWSEWIGVLIKLESLKDAVYWFRAHASDSYYMSDEEKTLLARYSNISMNDFGRGALDLDWFNSIYPQIGKANWSVLTEFAKYTQGGHRLVKLYSSIILKEVKIREITQKIKTKRDKDYLRGLGLVPLSAKTPQKDLLTRYNLMQTFLKESKQFGSQRQESEKNAVEIAMDNLSRTAGYSDSIRLSLAMEAKATKEIMQEAILKFDEVVLELKINDFGKADIFVSKEGKSQKSIPAKYKKEKAVKELVSNKNYLKKQYSRIIKFLEASMLNQEDFSYEDIEMLMQHPVVKALLSKLVLLNEKSSGFWKESSFVDVEGNSVEVDTNTTFMIAHPVQLHQQKVWSAYQKYAFDSELVQPFKQIFRELYLVTEDEKEKAIHSKRYEGHQIQVQKTVALLKTRGWRVDYDEGLHKVFHKEGYVARLYAMADWFSPSDVEAPTLEHVSFESLKDYKNIKLIEVDEVIFSEVMRDVDLVVSVAHVGGVDPEASHSTLEMRAVLAKESARLFKLDNIEVKERHIIIAGKLATYSVHLGSGMVSKDGLSLSIIPVHSQHRGRLFLPFIDDDPKSAEIISKMKMLAEDDKIQDPTVLEQISGR